MFYKVTILEKSDNHREMIVKADSKEAAVEMIPAAKAFLFPGEDTSKYIAFPESVHIDVMGAQVPHWRITVIRPGSDEARDEWEECGPGTGEMTLEAESEEDAIRQVREEIKCPAEFYAREVPMAEMIAEEKTHLERMIHEGYVLDQYGDVSVREFNRLMREKFRNTEEKERHGYEALRHFIGKIHLRNMLARKLDLAKLSVAEHENLISRLQRTKERELFMKLFEGAIEKYGKEANE